MKKVIVRLFAQLREKGPPESEMNVEDNCSLNHLLSLCHLPLIDKYIILVNGLPEWNYERQVQSGEIIAIFPPLGGG